MEAFFSNHTFIVTTIFAVVLGTLTGLLQRRSKELPVQYVYLVAGFAISIFVGPPTGISVLAHVAKLLWGLATYAVVDHLVKGDGGGSGRRKLRKWRLKVTTSIKSLIPTTPIPEPAGSPTG